MRSAALALAAVVAALATAPTPVGAEDPVGHVLTLVDATSKGDACRLRFTLRRSTARISHRTADLTFEFADPRDGHDAPLTGSVALDLDDVRPVARTMTIRGVGCDDLRPLRFVFACRGEAGPCGTTIALRNFRRLEIAEDRIAP
jgi:hypothetical protein